MKSHDCLEDLTWCKTTGYMAELMRHMQIMYNFKWQATKDPSGSWGVVPLSGPANVSGTWGGIIGSLVDQTAQISVSTWSATLNRRTMLDFAQIYPRGNDVGTFLLSPTRLHSLHHHIAWICSSLHFERLESLFYEILILN